MSHVPSNLGKKYFYRLAHGDLIKDSVTPIGDSDRNKHGISV